MFYKKYTDVHTLDKNIVYIVLRIANPLLSPPSYRRLLHTSAAVFFIVIAGAFIIHARFILQEIRTEIW